MEIGFSELFACTPGNKTRGAFLINRSDDLLLLSFMVYRLLLMVAVMLKKGWRQLITEFGENRQPQLTGAKRIMSLHNLLPSFVSKIVLFRVNVHFVW